RASLCRHRHFGDGHTYHAPPRRGKRGDDRADPDDGTTEPEPRDARDHPRADRRPREGALVGRGEDRVEIVPQARADPRRARGRRARTPRANSCTTVASTNEPSAYVSTAGSAVVPVMSAASAPKGAATIGAVN